MKDLMHLSLFSGIGGLDLAAEAAGFQTVGQCEWADYPTKVLEKHWPDVPRWRDIRTLTGDDFYARTGRRAVTVISGGFPCQPFSVAGKRRGKEDDRYLWPEMCRVISEIRPAWVIGENVPGIINLALDTVLSDLESQGYACQTFIIPAAGVDAPHRRERIAIVGWNYDSQPDGRKSCSEVARASKGTNAIPGGDSTFSNTQHERCDGRSDNFTGRSIRDWPERLDSENKSGGDERERGTCENSPNVADAGRAGLERPEQCKNDGRKIGGGAQSTAGSTPERSSDEGRYWPTEPDVGRVANGIPSRVDRLKCLGNAVVPQQFYPFFRYIAKIEKGGV